MKDIRCLVLLFCGLGVLALSVPSSAQAAQNPSYVPDETTAIAIAKAVLRPLVGRELVDGPKALPFYASIESPPHSHVWVVENAPSSRRKWTAPIIRVEMDRESGEILKANRDAQPIPAQSFVPDEETAKEMAKAVSRPQSAFPLHAHLNPDHLVWVVEDAPEFRKEWTNPIMRVEIDKKSGRVLRMGYDSGSMDEESAFRLNKDGTAVVIGTVIGKWTGCEVDGSCGLWLKVGEQKIGLITAEGDGVCKNPKIAEMSSTFTEGQHLKAYGIYKNGKMFFCESNAFYVVPEK